MPFLAEHLWQALVAQPCPDAPRSVFLAPWPEVDPALADEALLVEIAEVRRVVELGRQARGEANLKLRQPLRRVYVRGATHARSHGDEIREELRVKEVGFDEGPVVRATLKPNLPVLGPRLGKRLREVREALAAGDYEDLGDGRVRAAGEELGPDDVLRGEGAQVEGYAVASDDQISVALDTAIDDELRLEGRVLDLIRQLNDMRKQAGLEVTDRIRVRLPQAHADLLVHADWIKAEVLAVELALDGDEPPAIEKA
jgi:isoleucyl-tRNA synthetase